jgi:hypothetical protein
MCHCDVYTMKNTVRKNRNPVPTDHGFPGQAETTDRCLPVNGFYLTSQIDIQQGNR